MIQAPYPCDLAAKGWSLDLDYEQIEQSDTWAISSAEQKPWLLMLWLMSWRQVPVASLPDNDKLIAARIGMPVAQFAEWKDVLLSGWELADDGRLYHKTLTQHVLRMANKRDKDRARVAAFRDKSAGPASGNRDVTRYTGVTSGESSVSSTPTPTPTPTEELKPLVPDDSGTTVPHLEIISLYNTILGDKGLNRVRPKLWTGKRQANLRARWREDLDRQKLDWWEGYFEYVAESPFLTGNVPGERTWKADLEWLVNQNNMIKVCEGKYRA